MPGNNVIEEYNLTDREVQLIIKAMVTVLASGAKPDFEMLAKMTQYKDANAAAKNWYFTAQKLKPVGDQTDGKKKGKRQAADDHAAPPAKRGRVYKNDDDDEEQLVNPRVKFEADETRNLI